MALLCNIQVEEPDTDWYMGQSIQEWTKLNLWKTTCKKMEVIWSAEGRAVKNRNVIFKIKNHRKIFKKSRTYIFVSNLPLENTMVGRWKLCLIDDNQKIYTKNL